MKTTVDIAIPVLNEEESLQENVLKVLAFMEKELSDKFDFKLVIADNGSTDKTPEIAKELEKKYKGKILYHQVSKRGVGLALKSVWSASNADFVGYMDLDLATDLQHIPEALDALSNKNADIVYGSRLHKKSKVIGRTLKREIISRIFNLIVRIYLRTSFSDGMCGFKFLQRKHLKNIIENGANSDGWFFCTELLAVGQWQGLQLYELPVKWTDSPNSKVKIMRLSGEYLAAMRRLKNNRKNPHQNINQ